LGLQGASHVRRPPATKDDFLTVAVEPLDVAAGDAAALLAAMQKTAGAGRTSRAPR